MAVVSEKARKAAVPLPGERTQGETIAYLLAALTIGAVGLYLIQDLFAPAFFALTLVVTVRPMVSWMTRHRVPRVVAATAFPQSGCSPAAGWRPAYLVALRLSAAPSQPTGRTSASQASTAR